MKLNHISCWEADFLISSCANDAMLSPLLTEQADQHLLPVSHAARQQPDRQDEGGLTHGEGALRLMGLLPSASTSSSVLQEPGVPAYHIH